MTTLVQLYNQALSEVGASTTVSAADELSREAELCNLWFETARDSVLGAAPWPSAIAYARLALTQERDFAEPWVGADPTPQFRFRYAVPANLLKPYHLQSFARFEFIDRAISCHEETPILYYISRQTDLSRWSTDLVLAVMYRLAAHLAMPYTGKQDMANQALQKSLVLSDEVIASTANQQNQRYDTVPDFIQVRGYGGNAPAQRFFYPFEYQNIEASR